MYESHPEEELDHALDEFMRATDAFVSSWSEAVRRFGLDPVALKHFRELREAPLRATPTPALRPPAPSHPLWDRELDG